MRPITGFRRADGRVGIRNHVIVLPVDVLSNAATDRIAAMIPGALAIPHGYGRVQFGDELDLMFRTLIGTGCNPNVSAAVVIGIDQVWTDRVAAGIAATDKPVVGLALEGSGDLKTVERGARHVARMLQDASEQPRVPVGLDEVVVSMKCGESDPTSGLAACPVTGQFIDRHVATGGTAIFGETTELTGGEHLIASRCVDDTVRKRFLDLYERYIAFIQSTGADMLGSQPTEGNIRGGITTIEEKAMGNIAKIGSSPVVDALEPARAPSRPGLQFMDTPSASSECLTLMGAAGSVLHIFPTGQGNVIGNPIQPVIKLTANTDTANAMPEHIDLDVSGLLHLEYSLEEATDRLSDLVASTINGRLTASEVLGHREFDFTKLYRSA